MKILEGEEFLKRKWGEPPSKSEEAEREQFVQRMR